MCYNFPDRFCGRELPDSLRDRREAPFCLFCISMSHGAVLIRAGSGSGRTAAIGILDNLSYLNDFLLLSVCIVLG